MGKDFLGIQDYKTSKSWSIIDTQINSRIHLNKNSENVNGRRMLIWIIG